MSSEDQFSHTPEKNTPEQNAIFKDLWQSLPTLIIELLIGYLVSGLVDSYLIGASLIAGLTALMGTGYIIVSLRQGRPRTGRLTAAATMLVVGVVYVLLLVWRPWCNVQSVEFEVKLQGTGEAAPLSYNGTAYQVAVPPATGLKISAVPLGRSADENDALVCYWETIPGDGHITEDNGCVVVYLTGNDAAEDTVTVDAHQRECRCKRTFREVIFIQPRELP